MQDDDYTVRCAGQCGLKQADPDEALRAGWDYLEITRGWRCGACTRALREASAIVGLNEVSGDSLPPESRGALPRETASGIMAPSVKREP